MRLTGFLNRFLNRSPARSVSTETSDSKPAPVCDLRQCLALAEAISLRVVEQFANSFPFEAGFVDPRSQRQLVSAYIETWLLFASSETLKGIGAHGSSPAAAQFGTDLREAFSDAYRAAHARIATEIGADAKPGSPFTEYDGCISEVHPITVTAAEDLVVTRILAESYKAPSPDREYKLRALLQAAMYTYSERLGFHNPYEFFRQGGA